MREIFIKELNRKITLNEEDYKILLNRFDLRKRKCFGGILCVIIEPCLCIKYSDPPLCSECPLSPCRDLIKLFDKKGVIDCWGDKGLFWAVEKDEEAKKIIRKVRKTLKSMKMVNRKDKLKGGEL